jgi:hypothetical protein
MKYCVCKKSLSQSLTWLMDFKEKEKNICLFYRAKLTRTSDASWCLVVDHKNIYQVGVKLLVNQNKERTFKTKKFTTFSTINDGRPMVLRASLVTPFAPGERD